MPCENYDFIPLVFVVLMLVQSLNEPFAVFSRVGLSDVYRWASIWRRPQKKVNSSMIDMLGNVAAFAAIGESGFRNSVNDPSPV